MIAAVVLCDTCGAPRVRRGFVLRAHHRNVCDENLVAVWRNIAASLRAIGRAWHDDRVTLPDADCHCRACLDAHQTPLERMQRGMVVCRTCGNKRCPKASDHRHACTGSNDPGQAGSVYGPAMGAP